MVGQYVSIKRILAGIDRDLRGRDVEEADVIEWSGEALEFIGASTAYQPAVAVRLVTEFQTTIPKHLHVINQIARNNEWESSVTTEEELEEQDLTPGNDIPVTLDQYGMPANAYDLAYYRPYTDFGSETFTIGTVHFKKYQFTPVRLANHTFFNSLVCKENDFDGIYASCKDEYTVVENLLRFSFQEGQVMISYMKQMLDSDGYPMIPDTISNVTAIKKYIIMKLMEREFYMGREGSQQRLMKAEMDWHWYCRQAKNEDMMPQSIDEWQNIKDWKLHLMPKWNRYYGFFGALSNPQMLRM